MFFAKIRFMYFSFSRREELLEYIYYLKGINYHRCVVSLKSISLAFLFFITSLLDKMLMSWIVAMPMYPHHHQQSVRECKTSFYFKSTLYGNLLQQPRK